MPYRIPYGKDVLFDLPIITAGSQAFKVGATSAAGDVKVYHNDLIQTNPSGKTVAFTSGGTAKIKPGDTITGATSAATAIVMGVRITSGTWGGGDAAGFLFVRSDSGTFQAENLDTTTQANIATIAGALAAAGLFVHVGLGLHTVGVPGSQLLGIRGAVVFHDAAGAEWEDTAIAFETFDHPLAADPAGCLYAGTASSVTGTTLVGEASNDGIAHPLSADASLGSDLVILIESAATGAGQIVPVLSFVHATRTFTLRHAWALTPTGTISYKVYMVGATPTNVIRVANGTPLVVGGSAPASRIGIT